ncbi:DotI/IcmL/TraM family protein [Legionella spiritensis]|uniref:Macrophage killing protein with similarity to conjugation protein n=1 Tax=Legionella spiritensis TaxID=452 RepID=A0A0W0Z0W2_LEGSP|nr:DotI/IcmL/TraM family protein [Legionella spiritensis]KTD62542.1 Macrophage killing protein with similarity to conjugation protein [Legionella spiritensis]SNV30730.1 Macrophage killing protein with similarity to conjugation protein [Legionella spiritensis]VEG91977.1 Macrophage killing protein with similarity to conjugation protein [Legionella spiritensis]
MKTKNSCLLMLLYALLAPASSYADNTQVANWTQQVLVTTLSINYQEIQKELNANRVYYSNDAWEALGMFLGDGLGIVKNNHLVLHPKVLSNAQVVEQGFFSGMEYWRVNLSIAIPELGGRVDFSVLVLKASDPPYMIQSLNMMKFKY